MVLESRLARALALFSLSALVAGVFVPSAKADVDDSPIKISVQKNLLIDGNGQPVRLVGVNKSGSEYMCVHDWNYFDGQANSATVAAMKSWKINVVRVPLNEDCWLGINGVSPKFSGKNYRSAINTWVTTLQSAGIYAILDLHVSAPGATKATYMEKMADADHSTDFWSSVAAYFKSNHGVIFDLFNEPNQINWSCWRDGCTTKEGWQTAGMQDMVTAIREEDATQPIMLEGIGQATDLSQWFAYKPLDPLNQLIASNHNYSGMNFSNNLDAWNRKYAPIAAVVPLVTGELGQPDCSHGYIDKYMNWADENNVSYLAWTWNATSKSWPCSSHSLIADESGTPSPYGIGFRDHLLTLPTKSNLTTKVVLASTLTTKQINSVKVRSAKVENG